ncbi:MAG: aldehyde dehydrogenase family protein, partial [Treponema sp.]|nr:aldehyde dehydrogenase family protein [Treponema sp.]
MTEQEIQRIISKQRKFFESGKTLPVAFRKENLKKLYAVIKQNESEILAAVKKDLGKSAMESFMCEVGLVLEEISFMLKHVSKYAKKQVVKTPLAQFASKSYKHPSPRGVVLIMSPWNYPFMLTLSPLVDAIAAGNTVIIKPSAYSANTSKLIEEIFTKNFAPEYISVVSGGRAENECLLNQKFDYIFFTGSKVVGKTVMQKAAEHLTPVTLELGGKSPCVVEKSANLKLAAKRIVFGKFLNCGQTCVAPDFIYCDKSIKDELIKNILEEIK